VLSNETVFFSFAKLPTTELSVLIYLFLIIAIQIVILLHSMIVV